jgi:hypothetical protein
MKELLSAKRLGRYKQVKHILKSNSKPDEYFVTNDIHLSFKCYCLFLPLLLPIMRQYH